MSLNFETVNPILWTSLHYSAATKRHAELTRQGRRKEARALLRRITAATIAELKRSTLRLRPVRSANAAPNDLESAPYRA